MPEFDEDQAAFEFVVIFADVEFEYWAVATNWLAPPAAIFKELGDKTIDRSAFANSSVAFGRIGLRVFYSFSFGVNMGLAYFYDATSGKVEKPRDTGEQIKELNSHNFQVFIDARILNFGEQTYDR